MSFPPHPSQRGSVMLVAMCFVAVLGISLAGYIAVCSRTMSISNRTAQTGLGQQLAEAGLEEALRAYNKNDWSDWSNGAAADWTVGGTTATCNLTFPAGTFAQGATGSVKIRVDNYNGRRLDATWSSGATYRVNDLVGYNGIWYRSVRNGNTNQAPGNLTWWVPDPIPWKWRTSAPYAQYDLVNYQGIWYRCIAAHTSNATTFSSDSASWVAIPTQRAWSSSVSYIVNDVVAYTDPTTSDITLYRCVTAHTSSASIASDTANWSTNVRTLSLSWSSGVVHTRGSIVSYNGIWYYCIQSGTSNTAPDADTAMWAPFWDDSSVSATTPSSATTTAGVQYYVGDYAYRTGGSAGWYRCTTAHTFTSWTGAGNSAGNWTTTNGLPYAGWIYRSVAASQFFNNVVYYWSSPASAWLRYTGSWVSALTGSMQVWASGLNYNVGDAVYYSTTARWYRCIFAHTSSGTITPANTAYWSTAPVYSTAWDSGRQYARFDTVYYNGLWYFSILDNNYGQNPSTSSSYWLGSNTSNPYYVWNPATAYTSGRYVCYGGVWYVSTATNTNVTPNNSSYWTAAWAQSWGVTAGATVIYAEGTVNLPGSASTRTQLRATVAPSPLFPNAAAAASTISANSGGTVDSYDSTLGTYASQTGTATNYSAVLAAGYSAGTAITLSTAAVKGYLAVPSNSSSPYAPLYSSGGSVKGPASSASPNIDPSRISRSPYIPKFDTLPAGGLATNWATVPKGAALSLATTTNVGTPGDTVPSRYYYNGNLTIGTATINILRINGPVILYVNGDLWLTASGSTGRIEMTSAGSAEIHVAGALKVDASSDGILCYNTDPKSLIIICDTTGTATHYYSEGSNALYGTVYVPYSTSSTGVGSSRVDLQACKLEYSIVSPK